MGYCRARYACRDTARATEPERGQSPYHLVDLSFPPSSDRFNVFQQNNEAGIITEITSLSSMPQASGLQAGD